MSEDQQGDVSAEPGIDKAAKHVVKRSSPVLSSRGKDAREYLESTRQHDRGAEEAAGGKESIIEPYRAVLGEITSSVEADLAEEDEVTGTFEGIAYSVREPHLRVGRQAFVGIVDFTNPDGTTFSCVVRNLPSEARSYLGYVSAHPMIAEYVPQLYGQVGEWAVLEKLTGLELGEVEERMKTDREFTSRYAQHSYDLIERTATAGLLLEDVRFVDGDNVMVDPDTGESKLIEQTCLTPVDYRQPHELMTQQLFGELYQLATATEEVDPNRMEFAFHLLRNAFQQNSPEDLYVKAKVIGPQHKNFRTQWHTTMRQRLTDEAYGELLNAKQPTLISYGRAFTEAFTPGVIEAVQQNAFDTFSQLIKSRNYKMNITDKVDPRFGHEVIPDDGS